jgi:hypothetical protein
MSNEIVAAASLLIATTAILLTLWQNVLQRRSTQAQVFLHLLDKSSDPEVADGLELVTTLPTYESYQAFLSAESAEARTKVFRLVDFLNSMANLVEDGYLPRQKVWNLYFMIYRVAYEKLLPWWLEGLRKETYPQKFSNFERMCYAVGRISDKDMRRFDNKRNKRLAGK